MNDKFRPRRDDQRPGVKLEWEDAPGGPVKTWRERLGLPADFPLHVPSSVEWAMQGEIGELRARAEQAESMEICRFEALVKAATWPAHLHADTARLVVLFAAAMARKFAQAEKKYGYTNGWKEKGWMDECRAQLLEHLAKGDPRDVANYCAFLWWHVERTVTFGVDLAAGPDRTGIATLATVDCPACNGNEPCDECHGQGKVIISRADLAAALTEHADSEGGHHD